MKNIYISLFLLGIINFGYAQTFTPLDYNPALWLDASNTASIINTSGAVSAWNDISGNNNHATQSVTSNQPSYSNLVEGLDFDSDDVLLGNNLKYGVDATITLFVVAEPNVDSSKGSVIAKGQWTSGNDYRIELGEHGYDICIQNSREWNSSESDWNISHKNLVHTYYDENGETGFYLNGAVQELPRTDVSYSTNNDPFSIGGRFNNTNFFDGKIYEILLFQKKLTRCEILQVEGYLFHKWNMQSHIIATHPYKDQPFGVCDELQFNVDENSPNNTIIDTLEGTYVNNSVTFSDWRIEDEGLYKGLFLINSNGVLSIADNTNLDYELASAFNLEVSALASGVRVYGSVIININDLADGDAPKTHSELWGVNGEKWDSRGRLPDFSYVGYKSGEATTYEYGTETADVTNFGAIPNDNISDVTAINAAIASINSGIVYFPPGEYTIDNFITINKSNIVLRGAGNNATTGTKFHFPFNATELGATGNIATGDAGYIINFVGVNGGPNYTITENTKIGDRSVSLQNANNLQVGDYVNIEYGGSHPVDGELWNHILNNQNQDWPCSVAWSNGNSGLGMYHTIERIEGNIVTLKEPMRLDINTSWTPVLKKRTDVYVQNCGVEDIYMEHKLITQPNHLTEPGYNTIQFRSSFNCWVNNVSIENADNGILFKQSGYGEMKNITFNGRGGHHGWKFAYSSHCLADLIDFQNNAAWIHSFTLTHKANGNVVSNITGVPDIPISTDFHRNTPWETLITNVENDWNYNSSGVWCAGPNAGKRTVYWNMAGGFNSAPSWDDYQTTLVGAMNIPEKFHPEKGWHENVPTIEPANLYYAQLNRRLNLPADPLFTENNTLGNRSNYWERDPSRWEVKNNAYRLHFSETPSLTGNRLGEYSVLNSTFVGNMVITAKLQSLENLNLNPDADAALIVNYQDDNNYYFASINSNATNSGIYKVENGTTSLLKSINTTISTVFTLFSFENNAGNLILYKNGSELDRIADTTFTGGKVGFGSKDDAAAFDDTSTLVETLSTLTFEKDLQILVSPNPVRNLLIIESKHIIKSVTVYDMNGRLLVQKSDTSIDFSNFTEGIYLLTVTTTENIKKSFKIIKTH